MIELWIAVEQVSKVSGVSELMEWATEWSIKNPSLEYLTDRCTEISDEYTSSPPKKKKLLPPLTDKISIIQVSTNGCADSVRPDQDKHHFLNASKIRLWSCSYEAIQSSLRTEESLIALVATATTTTGPFLVPQRRPAQERDHFLLKRTLSRK